MSTTTALHFKLASRLAKLLGRQSLTNERDAVFELVKNAWDADAPTVEISFLDFAKEIGKIIISDTGPGMTQKDFEERFMVVATPSRSEESETPSGRTIVGEKGIGRFAMERLGRKTTIISYPNEGELAYKLTIEWDRYEVIGSTFDQIGNKFESFQKTDPEKHGVEIICELLRDSWNENKINDLNNKLGLLIIPEGFKTEIPFEILVTAPDFGISKKSIKTQLFNSAIFKINAELKDNNIRVKYSERKGKEFKPIDVKVSQCHLCQSEVKIEHEEHLIENVDMKCGSASYVVWCYPFDKPGEHHWSKKYGIRFVDSIREFTDDNYGIRIYRDGFRVLPYGEIGNDWTDRAQAQRGSSGALPLRSIIGWITISKKNPLVVTATRHKLIEDEKFEDLKKFVKEVDRFFDRFMHEKRVERRQEIKKNVPAMLEKTAKQVSKLDLIDEIKRPLIRNLKDCSAYLKELEEEQEKERDRLMFKVEAYRNLASLGLSTAAVAHELTIHLGNIIAISERIKRHLETGHLSKNALIQIAMNLFSSSRFIYDYMGFIKQFTATLKTDDPAFRKKKLFNVKEELKTSFQWFDHYFKRLQIKPIIELPSDLNVYMFQSDFQSIFMNLLSNSIKAIQQERKRMSEMDAAKKKNIIKISLDTNPRITNLQIIYSNDGPPINPKIKDAVFDSFVSDYDEVDKNMMGSGLGLPLTKEILESYGGDIELIESEFNPGVSFRIILPWEGIKT